jgi:hypothetical protein
MRRSSSFILLSLLVACAPSLRKPESPQLVVTGTVTAGGFERRGSPIEGATLVLRDAETGEELVRNQTSGAGGYRLLAPASAPRRVVLVVSAEGYAPHARAFTAATFSELTFSLSLAPLEALECVDEFCAAPAQDVEWVLPPEGAGGRVASFDLETEPPVQVDVDDARPAVLALAYAELAADGGALSGSLSLRVPLTRWGELVDATAGNGTLEVPTATFDPDAGRWSRGAAVALRTESGLPVPEADLPALRRAEYAGGAVAELPVVGSGFVAVLGGPAPEGCVEGTLSAEGKPAVGATLVLPGAEPRAIGSDGAFCVDVSPGEVALGARAQYAGLPYSLGSWARPSSPGRCASGGCAKQGSLALFGDTLRVAAMCRFTGKVIDPQGNALANAEVVAFDDSLTSNTVTAFCGELGARCATARPSGDDGSFSLTLPLLSSLVLAARVTTTGATGDAERRGAMRLSSCPTEPVTLRLNQGRVGVAVTPTFSGSTVSWEPPRAAARVTVLDGSGLPKWEVVAPGGLLPPLTVGTVPAGATEVQALTGAVVMGDSVLVEFDGVGRDGVLYAGSGSATRP